MNDDTIICPKCQTSFPLTAAIAQPMVDRLRVQFEADAAKSEASIKLREDEVSKKSKELETARELIDQELARKLDAERAKIISEQEQKAKEGVSVKLRDLQQQLAEKEKKLVQAQQTELDLLKQKRELDEQKSVFELEKARQIEAEREKIRVEATKVAADASAAIISDMQEKIHAKDKKLAETQEAEMTLRKQKTEFEEEKKSFELLLERSKDQIKDAVKKEKDEEFRLKEAEKNRQMEDLKSQIDGLKRKMEQGSQQAQGEILEVDLENALRRCFISDDIVAVPKGVHGGDVLQHVKDEVAHGCGTIIWESKRQKVWSEIWLGKLKDDKLAAKAQLAVLISTTMPKDVPTFECRANVWIAPPHLAIPLAAALRVSLIETATAKRAIEGRHDKMEVVYDYLSGPEFKGRVTAIAETLTIMREDLEGEKKAIQKIWSKREKQLERVMSNMAGMHGDLAGIIGKSLPTIDTLELSTGTDGMLPHGNHQPITTSVP